jgi:hypothetical protein
MGAGGVGANCVLRVEFPLCSPQWNNGSARDEKTKNNVANCTKVRTNVSSRKNPRPNFGSFFF